MIKEGRIQGVLRGGSWRTFHWKKLVIGRRLYRIQYADVDSGQFGRSSSLSHGCDETSSQSKGQRSSANKRSSRSEVRCHASTIHRSTLIRHACHSFLLF